MGEYQRQHFVPKLLQRFFSNDKRSIGCYIIDKNKYLSSPIRTTAQRNWYYKFDDNEKNILEHWLGDIEKEVAPLLERLVNNPDYQLSTDEYEACLGFALLQLMRTPKAIHAMKYVFDFCKQKHIPEVIEEVNKGVRTDENIPFQTVIGVSSVIDGWPGKSMLVLRNTTDDALIMSDNPACLFSPLEAFAEIADLTKLLIKQPTFSGNMLYLPVNPSCALLLFDERYYKFECKKICHLTREDVHAFNSLEIRNASNILLFREGSFEAESYIEDIEFRNTKSFEVKHKTIYTPVDDNFSLSILNCDRELWKYLICTEAAKTPEATLPKIKGLMCYDNGKR